MTKPVCLVTGVGPGTGSAIVRRFAEDYDIAMLARSRPPGRDRGRYAVDACLSL